MAKKSNIIDFVSKRNEIIEKKRRRFERVLFDNFFDIKTTIAGDVELMVDLIDVSHGGCRFRILEKEAPASLKKGRVVTLNIYFAEGNYIPVSVAIGRSPKSVEGNGNHWKEYGGKFDKSLSSFQAMEAFVDFVYKYAEFSHTDYEGEKAYG